MKDSILPNVKSEPSTKYAYYALIVILIANLINYADRFLVSAVLPDIKSHFNISGMKEGLLWTAFTLGYMLSAPLIGYLSDRKRRPTIFAVCVFIWSLATIASGLSGMTKDYNILFISRVVIGVGEAGCLIVGPTLLSDYFPERIRGKILAIFYLGMPLGSIAGFLLGGKIPLWQTAFYIAGAVGIPVALLILILREPMRGGLEGTHHTSQVAGIKSYIGLLRNKTLMYIIFAQAAASFAFIPLVHFGTSYLQEVRQLTKGEAAAFIGIIGAAAGICGTFIGGYLGDKLYRKTKAAYSIVAAIGFFLGFLFVLLGLISSANYLYMSGMFFAFFFFFMCMPAVNTQIADVTIANQRAVAYSLAVFATHFFGDTISPPIFGRVKNVIGMEETLIIFSIPLIISGLLCIMAARYAGQDKDKIGEGAAGAKP